MESGEETSLAATDPQGDAKPVGRHALVDVPLSIRSSRDRRAVRSSGSVKWALLVVAALLVSVWWQRRRRYRGIFRAPATRDDRLVCSGPHTEIEVTATADGFELPPGLLLSGRSAFLELDVRATALVFLRDPFLDASLAGAVSRQYFERAVRGRRLVDISALFGGPTKKVGGAFPCAAAHSSGHP